MSLRFIYGRSGTGKSHFCLNNIKEEIDKGVSNKLILIVPEQFSSSPRGDFLNILEIEEFLSQKF